MANHFRAVKDRMRSGSDSGEWEPIEDSQNELTRDLRRG